MTTKDRRAMSWPAPGSEEERILQAEYDAFCEYRERWGINDELSLYADDRKQRELAQSVDNRWEEGSFNA